MKLLSIDTSTKNFSLAVCDGDKILAEKNIQLDKILSDSIIPSIEQILKKSKLSLAKLDGFVVGLGPGSFTSLRVGLSTIKAFALAIDKPVVGIASLDAIALGIKEDGPVCVITDARRNMVYACMYEKQQGQITQKGEYLLTPLEDLLKTIKGQPIFVGDGVIFLKDKKYPVAKEEFWYSQAKYLIPLALERFKDKETENIDTLVPLYLYPEDCQVQK